MASTIRHSVSRPQSWRNIYFVRDSSVSQFLKRNKERPSTCFEPFQLKAARKTNYGRLKTERKLLGSVFPFSSVTVEHMAHSARKKSIPAMFKMTLEKKKTNFRSRKLGGVENMWVLVQGDMISFALSPFQTPRPLLRFVAVLFS